MGSMAQLALKVDEFRTRIISPLIEMGAYEALWLQPGASFKSIADKFRADKEAVPSDFVPKSLATETAHRVLDVMRADGVNGFGVRVHGAGEYPTKLRDAKHPIELLYYRGWWDLVDTRCVAIVGTRNPTEEGIGRTRRLVRQLVGDGFTIVSGLAKGIDSEAHRAAVDAGGKTIAVLGTPLNRTYPAENADLQSRLAKDFLLISQVPVLKYLQAKNPRVNSYFFPERNVTMSALTLGTVIVEAGETSGALYQARAAIEQGRKLFILDSCFNRRDLAWPAKYADRGAVRVADYEDIRACLPLAEPSAA